MILDELKSVFRIAKSRLVDESLGSDLGAEVPHSCIKELWLSRMINHPPRDRQVTVRQCLVEHTHKPSDPEVYRLKKFPIQFRSGLALNRNVSEEEGRDLRSDSTDLLQLEVRILDSVTLKFSPSALDNVDQLTLAGEHAQDA